MTHPLEIECLGQKDQGCASQPDEEILTLRETIQHLLLKRVLINIWVRMEILE